MINASISIAGPDLACLEVTGNTTDRGGYQVYIGRYGQVSFAAYLTADEADAAADAWRQVAEQIRAAS